MCQQYKTNFNKIFIKINLSQYEQNKPYGQVIYPVIALAAATAGEER